MPEPLRPFASKLVPLLADNVDTDQIIPARFLKGTSKDGLGEGLFADWRYDGDGQPREGFVLNRPEMAGRAVLLAGANFGSGSSREHAAWALRAFGIRAVLAPLFADIFRNNALKNGLLPVELPADAHAELAAAVGADPDAAGTVDLSAEPATPARRRPPPPPGGPRRSGPPPTPRPPSIPPPRRCPCPAAGPSGSGSPRSPA